MLKNRIWVSFSILQAVAGLFLFEIGASRFRAGGPIPIASQLSFGINFPAALLRAGVISTGVLDGHELLEAVLYFLGCFFCWLWTTSWLVHLVGRRRWADPIAWVTTIIVSLVGTAFLVGLVAGISVDQRHVLSTFVALWAFFLLGSAIVSIRQLRFGIEPKSRQV
jgi:hypothetical protein